MDLDAKRVVAVFGVVRPRGRRSGGRAGRPRSGGGAGTREPQLPAGAERRRPTAVGDLERPENAELQHRLSGVNRKRVQAECPRQDSNLRTGLRNAQSQRRRRSAEPKDDGTRATLSGRGKAINSTRVSRSDRRRVARGDRRRPFRASGRLPSKRRLARDIRGEPGNGRERVQRPPRRGPDREPPWLRCLGSSTSVIRRKWMVERTDGRQQVAPYG